MVWYKNIASLLASLVVPLSLLAYWNFQTFKMLSRRRYFRPSTSASVNNSITQPSEDNNAAGAAVLVSCNILELPSVRDRRRRKSAEGTFINALQQNSTFYFYHGEGLS